MTGRIACRRPKTGRVLRHGILLVFLTLGVYPLAWMGLSAVRHEADLLEAPFSLPARVTMQNVRTVLRSGAFGRAYVNSIVVCTGGVACAVALSALAAFAFARLEFRGRDLLFLLFLGGMMIPVHVTLIPLNRLLGARGLGLKDTYWALIGPYAGFALPVSILILRGAFANIAQDLIDAARIDGCTVWGVFWHVGLPLVRPALATVTIFNFLTMWNEFAFALTLMNNSRMRTLPLALWQFKGERGMMIAETCAALCVAVVPALLVYCVAQKQIIRGLTAGALKG